MQELQRIFSNPLWNLAALIITIAAVILAILFYLKGKKVKKPEYYIKSNNLVTDFSSKLSKLKMLYNNTEIKSLTVSKMAFWNEGAETINNVDIADTEPLRIEAVGSCDILDAIVIKEINPVNKFRVEIINRKEVKILFDFLDKGQGGAIQIIHTGKESSDIKVDGFVKSAGKPLPSYRGSRILDFVNQILSLPKPAKATKPQPAKARLRMAIAFFFAAPMMLIPFFSEGDAALGVFGSAVSLIYVYFGYSLLKRRVPKGLEIVEEEDI